MGEAKRRKEILGDKYGKDERKKSKNISAKEAEARAKEIVLKELSKQPEFQVLASYLLR